MPLKRFEIHEGDRPPVDREVGYCFPKQTRFTRASSAKYDVVSFCQRASQSALRRFDETFDSFSKDSVIVFKKPPQDEIHIEDVKQVNGQWLVAGTSGVILIVIGMGPTMRQAQSQVYSRIKNVLIPNMYYRTDIGDRWVEDTDRLHTWGYLR